MDVQNRLAGRIKKLVRTLPPTNGQGIQPACREVGGFLFACEDSEQKAPSRWFALRSAAPGGVHLVALLDVFPRPVNDLPVDDGSLVPSATALIDPFSAVSGRISLRFPLWSNIIMAVTVTTHIVATIVIAPVIVAVVSFTLIGTILNARRVVTARSISAVIHASREDTDGQHTNCYA